MVPDIGGDGLIGFLLLVAFLILVLPPLVATITGIVCGNAMPGLPAGWGPLVGLGPGVAGTVINIAGLIFLLNFVDVNPEGWAREIFCRRPFYTLYGSSTRNIICTSAVEWAPEPIVFWIGISLVTPAAAAMGTWWLCRRRSINQR